MPLGQTCKPLRCLTIVLIWVNGMRIRGILRMDSAMTGVLPSYHLLLGLGDLVAGVLAVALSVSILRLGITSKMRTLALIWAAFGSLDLMIGLLLESFYPSQIEQFHQMTGMEAFLFVDLVILVLVWSARPSGQVVEGL